MITSSVVFRALLYGLAVLAISLALYLFVHRDARLATKVLWIAALMVAIATNQSRLPFFACEGQACIFYRNAFVIISVFLVSVSAFVLFRIQLPDQRIPRFYGRVLVVSRENGREIPQVEYQDGEGQSNVFADPLASIILRGHRFVRDERVVVRAPKNAPPHVDKSWIARWLTTMFLLLMTAIAISFSILCHLRVHGVSPRS